MPVPCKSCLGDALKCQVFEISPGDDALLGHSRRAHRPFFSVMHDDLAIELCLERFASHPSLVCKWDGCVYGQYYFVTLRLYNVAILNSCYLRKELTLSDIYLPLEKFSACPPPWSWCISFGLLRPGKNTIGESLMSIGYHYFFLRKPTFATNT